MGACQQENFDSENGFTSIKCQKIKIISSGFQIFPINIG